MAAASASRFDHAVVSEVMGLEIVPAARDNFMYLLWDKKTKQGAIVDPFDPKAIFAKAKQLGVKITAVLTTHSHNDHDGGNPQVARMDPSIVIYGGKGDRVKAVTKELTENDVIQFGSIKISVIATPCHTIGHICYFARCADMPSGLVFTGDTLFVGGCGNFFAGTPKMMFDNFIKLSKLPKDTLVYCGHEYTIANFQYADYVEPENAELRLKHAWVLKRREARQHTVPSTIKEEIDTNPFMRAVLGVDTLVEHVGTTNLVQAIKFVREEKSAGDWKRKLCLRASKNKKTEVTVGPSKNCCDP